MTTPSPALRVASDLSGGDAAWASSTKLRVIPEYSGLRHPLRLAMLVRIFDDHAEPRVACCLRSERWRRGLGQLHQTSCNPRIFRAAPPTAARDAGSHIR